MQQNTGNALQYRAADKGASSSIEMHGIKFAQAFMILCPAFVYRGATSEWLWEKNLQEVLS